MNVKQTIMCAGQWVASVLPGVGIGIEIALRADIGLVVITIGSALFSMVTKIGCYRRR